MDDITGEPFFILYIQKGTSQWKHNKGHMQFYVVSFKWTFNFRCEIMQI